MSRMALKRSSSDDGSTSEFLDGKGRQLQAMLNEPVIDLWQLRELALSEGGLVNDSIRRKAWPALTGLYTAAAQEQPKNDTPPPSPNPRDVSDFHQVELDCARCTWHLLTGNQRLQRLQMENKRNKRIAKIIKRKQSRLATCIERTLSASAANKLEPNGASSRLHYYQGFHDVACIFLATLRDGAPPRNWTLNHHSEATTPALSLDLPSAVLLQVSQSHLPDMMKQTFQPLQTTLVMGLFPLLAVFDPAVHEHLRHAGMEPYFALPWVLSWFSHEIRDTALVKRLFDAFVASHPLMPLYLTVAMLSHPYNRQHILGTDCEDFSALHQTLAGLPKHSSAVGWRYQPGAGYVSDHEEEESVTTEEDNDSTHSECSSLRTGRTGGTDGELVLLQAGILEKTVPTKKEYGATDSLSINSTMSTAQITASVDDEFLQKVPFQELFDTAVKYMHRIPPRRILKLAQKYHGRSFVQQMMEQCKENNMLPRMLMHDPAAWALNPTSPSDVWLKTRAREARGGLPPRSSRSGGRGAPQTQQPKPSTVQDKASQGFEPTPPSSFLKILRKQNLTRAAIASGMALSTQEEKRWKQRKRIAVMLLSILIAILAWKCRGNRTTPAIAPVAEVEHNTLAPESACLAAEEGVPNGEAACPAPIGHESGD